MARRITVKELMDSSKDVFEHNQVFYGDVKISGIASKSDGLYFVYVLDELGESLSGLDASGDQYVSVQKILSQPIADLKTLFYKWAETKDCADLTTVWKAAMDILPVGWWMEIKTPCPDFACPDIDRERFLCTMYNKIQHMQGYTGATLEKAVANCVYYNINWRAINE